MENNEIKKAAESFLYGKDSIVISDVLEAYEVGLKSDVAKKYWFEKFKSMFESAFNHEINGLPHNTVFFENWYDEKKKLLK